MRSFISFSRRKCSSIPDDPKAGLLGDCCNELDGSIAVICFVGAETGGVAELVRPSFPFINLALNSAVLAASCSFVGARVTGGALLLVEFN